MASETAVDTATIEVKCGDRGCTTGQTILETNNTGRKVISHFFGRNKKSTKAIDFHVWHHLCRMTYQRSRYAAEKSGPRALCQYYLDHLTNQFVRLRLWRPQATFTIQLWEPARKRLATYHAILLRGGSEDEANLQVAVTPGPSKRGEKPKPLNEAEAINMEHAEYIDEHLTGKSKTIDHVVDTIIPWIQQEVSHGNMLHMPPIEFLINSPAENETVIDPKTNYSRWEAHVDGREYQPTSPSSPSTSSSLSASTPQPPPPPPASTSSSRLPKLRRLSARAPQLPVKLDLSLARFRASAIERNKNPSKSESSAAEQKPEGEGEVKKRCSAAENLPLYQPPSPTILAALKKKSGTLKRAMSVDTALDNVYVSSENGSESGFSMELGPPVMARGMVFAGGKVRFVPRKRGLDEEVEEGENQRSQKKVKREG